MTHSLKHRHQRLDEQIRAEMAQRFPDSEMLKRLKRLKLRVKDRLHASSAPRPQPA